MKEYFCQSSKHPSALQFAHSRRVKKNSENKNVVAEESQIKLSEEYEQKTNILSK